MGSKKAKVSVEELSLDQLSLDQLRLYLKEREKKEVKKVYKEGFLKKDLYAFDSYDRSGVSYYNRDYDCYLSEKAVKEIIKDFTNKFSRILKKGDRFVAFKYDDELYWFDDVGYGLENMREEWAEHNLIGIKDLTEKGA